jgi:site-specific DNA recombinase
VTKKITASDAALVRASRVARAVQDRVRLADDGETIVPTQNRQRTGRKTTPPAQVKEMRFSSSALDRPSSIRSLPGARRVFGYARVSSVEQIKGTSLQDQQNAIAAHAKTLGLKVTRQFVEAETGIGEKAEKREQIQTLLREVRRGDLVLCYALDRWSRDVIFTHQSTRDLKAQGVDVFFIADHLDPSTDAGEMQLGYMAVGAQAEHKRIRQRLIGTRNRLRDAGYYAGGHPPFGYRRTHAKGALLRTPEERLEKNVLVIMEKEAAVVRRVFAMCIGGAAFNAIARELQCKRDFVHDTLHNRAYLGELRNSEGRWIKGRHKPIVTHDIFVKAQNTIAARRYGGPRPRDAETQTSTWWLRDLARCAKCGARMSAAYAGRQPDGTYARMYYACSAKCGARDNQPRRANRGTHIPVRLVEMDQNAIVIARLYELRDELSAPPKVVPLPAPKSVEQRRAALNQKRARYVEMYSDGVITKSDLSAKVAKVDADLLKLDAAQPAPSPLADDKTRKKLFHDIAMLWATWPKLDPKKKRQVVNLLAHAIYMAHWEYDTNETPEGYKHRHGFVWRSADELALSDIASGLQ